MSHDQIKDQLKGAEAHFARAFNGVFQLGARAWHWPWEAKAGRATIRRLVVLAGGGWSLWRLGNQWHWIWAAALAAAILTAYLTADQTEPAIEDQAEEEAELTPEEIVLQLVVDLIGDAPGIHLDTLLDRLREVPQWAAMERDDLRLVLDAVGCPIRRKLRVGDRTGIAGVHRDDAHTALQALAEDDTPLPPPGLDPEP